MSNYQLTINRGKRKPNKVNRKNVCVGGGGGLNGKGVGGTLRPCAMPDGLLGAIRAVF
jgi:hypothetical protein